jgi:cytoskeletal protein CcmA (bactofilin family)
VPAPAAASAAGVRHTETLGSKLFVGVNIKLKGVEISDCDVLVIEGHVEATVHSKTMQIAKPGTLAGTALIDVAEIHGEFSGELTARTRLVVHGTGRVRGTVRYGKLVVAEGGELNGDVKRLDAPNGQARLPALPASDARKGADAGQGVPMGSLLGPEP